MRRTFIRTLVELAEADDRIVLLTGDLGYTVIEPFADRFPDRFYNLGVAEQNMIGVATGLAEAGFIPFAYSLATFASLRAYEFIRNGPVLHQLPVRIVGVGGGFEYGVQGATHHGLEDIATLRVQPGMTVLAPADHEQLTTALRATWDLPGPVYYRVGKDETTTVPGLDGRFTLGGAEVLDGAEAGIQIAIVAMGAVAAEAATAVGILRGQGVGCTAIVVASVSPPPVADLVTALADAPVVITVEAHYAVGGLGSLVAEVVADHGLGCRVIRQGVRLAPGGPVGSQEWFHDRAGLSADALVSARRPRRPRTGFDIVTTVSIILPVHNQADHIGAVVAEYLAALADLAEPAELLLVVNGCTDGSNAICDALAFEHETVQSIPSPRGGWGHAVRHGLAAATGELLCYTNTARTDAADLRRAIGYAMSLPGVVVKANRKIREGRFRRLGSLLFNLECRALFDLSAWDVNGTPKVFPRTCDRLLELTRDDDLIDAEFALICRTEGYPMVELPIFSTRRHGGRSTTNGRSALRLYRGAFELRRAMRP